MFPGEHFARAKSSSSWKWVISSRGTEVGSGRINPAAKDALAIASVCDAIGAVHCMSKKENRFQ